MVKKYVTALEGREINTRTGEIWKVDDVPVLWRTKVLKQIESDGYVILEDGTVDKPEPETQP